MESWQMR